MNKNITKIEYLSSVLDDEAGKFEQKRILNELQQDDAMLDKVASFSLIGEVMRNKQSSCTVQKDFLRSIHGEIAKEPTYNKVQASSNKSLSFWGKPIINMGLAAGLGAVALFSFNMFSPSLSLQQQQQASSPDNTYMVAETIDAEEPVVYAHDEEWRERLRSYVDQHAKYASTSAIMPSVRAVSYSTTY